MADEPSARPPEPALTPAAQQGQQRPRTDADRWVDVAHEALIRNWPRLRQWIDDDRAGLRLHRRITEAAQDWLRQPTDDNLLWRGTRLAAALDWRTANEAELNDAERRYLDAGLALREREAQALRDQAQRELDHAQQLAAAETRRAEVAQALVLTERAGRRRQRLFTVGLGVLAAAALVIAVIAETQRRRADTQQQLAVARQLDTAARTTDGSSASGLALRLLLAIESLRSADTPQARQQLADDLALLPQLPDRSWRAHGGAVTAVAFSRDARWLATQGTDGKLRVWDAAAAAASSAEPRPLATLDAPADFRTALAFSPDGRWLVGGCGGAACVWDTALWRLDRRLPSGKMVWGIAFSDDGRLMSHTGYHQPDARLVDIAQDWAERAVPSASAATGGPTYGVAFSPDARWLLTGTGQRIVQRPIDAGAGTTQFVTAPQGSAWRLTFSPDRSRLAAAADNGSLTLYAATVAADGHLELTGTGLAAAAGLAGKLSVDFSADGHFVATIGGVWSIDGAAAQQRVREVHAPTALAFSARQPAALASGLRDGVVEWRSRFDGGIDLRRLPHGRAVSDIAFSGDGARLATAGEDGQVRVFEVASGRRLAALPLDAVERVVWSSDGRWLAAAGRSGLQLYDARAGWSQQLSGVGPARAEGVAFSADGRWLAAVRGVDGDRHRQVQLFATANPAVPPVTVEVDGAVGAVVFSPDSRLFAVRTARRCARGMADIPGSTTVWPIGGGAALASRPDLTSQRLDLGCRGEDGPQAAAAAASAVGDAARVDEARGWPSMRLDTPRQADAATSPNGRWVARSAGPWRDHSVRIEPTRAADLVALTCARLPAAVATMATDDWKRLMQHEPQPRPSCPGTGAVAR